MSRFTPDFLSKVVDTLLPGLPTEGNKGAIPAASEIGIDRQLAGHLDTAGEKESHTEVLAAIAGHAGGETAFIALDADGAEGVLGQVEAEMPEAFISLLDLIAADYYEHPKVVTAFGWRPGPPQPEGYPLEDPSD